MPSDAYKVVTEQKNPIWWRAHAPTLGLSGDGMTEEKAKEDLRQKATAFLKYVDDNGQECPPADQVVPDGFPVTDPFAALIGQVSVTGDNPMAELLGALFGGLGAIDAGEEGLALNNIGQIINHYEHHTTEMLDYARVGNAEEVGAHMKVLRSHLDEVIPQVEQSIKMMGSEGAGRYMSDQMREWDSKQ